MRIYTFWSVIPDDPTEEPYLLGAMDQLTAEGGVDPGSPLTMERIKLRNQAERDGNRFAEVVVDLDEDKLSKAILESVKNGGEPADAR